MKNSLFLVCLTAAAFLLLTFGCQKGSSDGETQKSDQTSISNSGANDPRWRNELFQSSVTAIRERAAFENPEQYLNSLNQVVDRFNSWIQSRPQFEGWQADPMTAQTVKLLDSFEPLGTQFSETFLEFRNAQENVPFTEEQTAKLNQLAEALKNAASQIPETTSSGLQFLRQQFQHERKLLLFQLLQNQVLPDLKANLKRLNYIFSQLGILMGSQRLEFRGAETSKIPITPNETFTMAYENDVYVLFEQFLLQDVSLWAQGIPSTELEEIRLETRSQSDSTGALNRVQISAEDLERMKCIFQWTASNVALRSGIDVGGAKGMENSAGIENSAFNSPIPETTLQLPLEILLSGSGTVLERAWLTILLARQQDLNAFLIEVPAGTGSRTLVGFLHNDDIYLFDPELGLPVWNPASSETAADSASGWVPVRENGSLKGTPARWSDVCAAPAILETFWKTAGLNVSVSVETLKNAKVFLEASPWYQTQRNTVLQEALKNGKNRAVMSLSSVEVLADGTISEASLDAALNAPSSLKRQILRKNAFASVEVWNWPVDGTIFRAFHPEAEMNRMKIFQKFCVCFPDGGFNLWRAKMLYLKGCLTGPMSAAGYCQRARLSETLLEQNFQKAGPTVLDFYRYCRCDASFSLGMISLMLGRAEAAADSFDRHVIQSGFLELREPARFHCGQMYELKGDWNGARKFYSETSGPMKVQAAARLAFLPKEETPEMNAPESAVSETPAEIPTETPAETPAETPVP